MSGRTLAFCVILVIAVGTALAFYRYFIAAKQVHELELHEPAGP